MKINSSQKLIKMVDTISSNKKMVIYINTCQKLIKMVDKSSVNKKMKVNTCHNLQEMNAVHLMIIADNASFDKN